MNIPMQCNPLTTGPISSNNNSSNLSNNLSNSPSSPSSSSPSQGYSVTSPSQTSGSGSSALQRQALALKLSSSMQLAKCGISPAWGLKNPTFEAVMRNYSPANWGVVAQSARRAYLWVCPTVGALAPLFGPRCPVMWLDEQVTHLFLTSQSRDASAAAAQIEAFVGSFVGTVAEFKLTEVMLFLARYKAGVYGRSFAAFDVRNVGQTFHHEFVQQRRQELQAIEAEATAGRDGEERRLRAAHAVSREAYLRLQRDGGRVGLKVWLRAAALSAGRVWRGAVAWHACRGHGECGGAWRGAVCGGRCAAVAGGGACRERGLATCVGLVGVPRGGQQVYRATEGLAAMTVRHSTLVRRSEARRLAMAHYEPGNQARSLKYVWRHFAEPQLGIGYRTFLRYIR